jgi:hypothetical protein
MAYNLETHSYENVYPASIPVNGLNHRVPISLGLVPLNGHKTSNRTKIPGSALVGNKFRPESKFTQKRIKLKNVWIQDQS